MKRILYIVSIFSLLSASLFGQSTVADTTDLKLIPSVNNGKLATIVSGEYQGAYRATNVSQTPNALTIFASVKSGWYWVKISDVLKITKVPLQADILDLSAQAGERIFVSPGELSYIIQDAAVSGYTTDSAVVIPTKNSKYAVLQPNTEGRYQISALRTFSPTTMERFFDFVGMRGGRILWDRNVTLTFTNGEDIDINYDIDIISPTRDTLFSPTEPEEGLNYTLFYKADNVNFSVDGLVVRGPKDGRVSYSGSFTRADKVVTVASGIFDDVGCPNELCDEGRYLYFNDTVRVRITAVNSTTEVEIANTSGVPTSGTATLYRENDTKLINTTGSTIPSSKNLVTDVPLAGQRFIRVDPALDDTYIGGYIYITIDGTEYERRILEVSSDTLFFSNQLPDSITTYPSTATIGKWASIRLKNVDFSGEWRNVLFWSGGDGIIDIDDNSYFSSNVSILSMFADNSAKNVRCHVRNSFFIETGIGWYGDGNTHPTDPNGIGIYLHPHINAIIDNCYFYGNYRDHLKFFSSSDSQTTIAKYQKVTNCHFEYGGSALQESLYQHFDIINYTRGTATIANCTGDGKIQIRGNTDLVNSTFDRLTISNPRDSAVYNISNSEFTGMTEITGAGTYEYFANVSNTRIVDTDDLGQGIMAQHGTWTVSNCWIDIQGANGVGIRSQGASFYISDTYIKTYHTSGNYYSLDVNGTQYDDIDFNATNVTILGGQISLAGSASYTERVFFNNVKFVDGCTDCSIRIVGSNLDEYENSRGRNAGRDTVEYGAADDVIEVRKNMDYEMDVNAGGAPIVHIKTSDGVETGVTWRDEFKLNFVSGAVFQSGLNFDFTQTFSAGDWAIIRRDGDKWVIYEKNGYTQTEIDSALISQNSRELNQNDTLKTADFGKILYNDDTSNDTLYIPAGITADVFSQYVGIETYNSASIVIITDATQLRDIENTLIDTLTVKAAAIRRVAADKFRLLSSSEVYITASDTAAMLTPYLTSSTGYIQDSLYTQTQVDSIISAQNGWAHYVDTAYATAADSFYVAQGSTATLPLKANMADGLVTSYLPNGVDSLFSQHDSTILGIATAATYTVRVNFKAKNSSNTGYATLALDIGTGGTPNIVTAETLTFPKGAGIETQESKTILLYSLDTFIANGCKIKVTADTGNLEIYDIRLLIRLDSRP